MAEWPSTDFSARHFEHRSKSELGIGEWRWDLWPFKESKSADMENARGQFYPQDSFSTPWPSKPLGDINASINFEFCMYHWPISAIDFRK